MDVLFALKAVPSLGKAGKKVLVPLGAGAIAVVGFAGKGAVDVWQGRGIRAEARDRFDAAIGACESTRVETERVAVEYGQFQIGVHKETVGRFADWLERHEHLVKRLEFEKVDGVRIQVPDIPRYVAAVDDVATGVLGLASGVGAGVAAQAGALWGVSAFASASTGTAISTLSGAAAQNAILAWFGGGAVAAGGGGVAAGGIVVGLVAIVPGLLVGGMTMGVVGARKKSKAREFAASVEVEINRIGLAEDMLRSTERRIRELRSLLEEVVVRAAEALDRLDGLEFDPDRHAREFLRALQLVTAVKEILNTSVLDPESGELTEASVQVLRKYA